MGCSGIVGASKYDPGWLMPFCLSSAAFRGWRLFALRGFVYWSHSGGFDRRNRPTSLNGCRIQPTAVSDCCGGFVVFSSCVGCALLLPSVACGRPSLLSLFLFLSSHDRRDNSSPSLDLHLSHRSALASLSHNTVSFDVVSAFEGTRCGRHYPVPRKFEVPPNPLCSGCILELNSADPVVAILESAFDLPPFVERLVRPAVKPCFGYYILPISYIPPTRSSPPKWH